MFGGEAGGGFDGGRGDGEHGQIGGGQVGVDMGLALGQGEEGRGVALCGVGVRG